MGKARYAVGDQVWVNGFGEGEVSFVDSHAGARIESDFYYSVKRTIPHRCECGNTHTRTEFTRAEAIHMRSYP